MLKIHPVFHILLLESVLKNAKIAKNIEINNNIEQEYKVKQILNHKRISRKPYYLVKWKGYDTLENTWEPIKNLTNYTMLIHQYSRTQKAADPSPQLLNSN